MADVLNVEVRNDIGTKRIRRLRKTGKIPAVLYGHKEAVLNLALRKEEFAQVLRHSGKVVKLAGAASEDALVRDVQWDTYGVNVLHVDLVRVDASERVTTDVTVELKGTAVGLSEGGVIQFITHELEIECPAMSIPEKIVLNISGLALGKSIHASEVPLPEGAVLTSPPEVIVVQCVTPHVEELPVAGAATGAEPEVVGKKATEEEGAEAEKK